MGGYKESGDMTFKPKPVVAHNALRRASSLWLSTTFSGGCS